MAAAHQAQLGRRKAVVAASAPSQRRGTVSALTRGNGGAVATPSLWVTFFDALLRSSQVSSRLVLLVVLVCWCFGIFSVYVYRMCAVDTTHCSQTHA